MRPRLLLRALKGRACGAVGLASAEIVSAVGVVYVAIQHLVVVLRAIRASGDISRTSVLAGTISAVGWQRGGTSVVLSRSVAIILARTEAGIIVSGATIVSWAIVVSRPTVVTGSIIVARTKIAVTGTTVVVARASTGLKLAAIGARIVASNIVVVHVFVNIVVAIDVVHVHAPVDDRAIDVDVRVAVVDVHVVSVVDVSAATTDPTAIPAATAPSVGIPSGVIDATKTRRPRSPSGSPGSASHRWDSQCQS